MAGTAKAAPEDEARGARMAELRKALGFKRQEDLADAAKITRTRYNRVETGHDKMTSANLQGVLANLVGVKVGDLIEYARGYIALEDIMARRSGQRTVEREARYPLVAQFVRHLRARKEDDAAIAAFEDSIPDYKGEPTETELAELWRKAQLTAKHRDKLLGLERPRSTEIDPALNKRPNLTAKPTSR